MTSRERVLTALNHREPDRIPVTLAYETPAQILQRYGRQPSDLLMRQDIASVALREPPPPDDVRMRFFSDMEFPPDVLFDAWGVARWRSPTGESYGVAGPLRHTEHIAEIEAFPWSDCGAACWAVNLPVRIIALHNQGVAVQGAMSGTIFEQAWAMFGMERLLMALQTDLPLALRLFDIITELKTAMAIRYARAGVDILRLGDDIADQRGMLFAPELWRQTLKPRLAAIIAATRAIRPNLPIFYHSDGNVGAIIEDLIEVGVTILNPVQPEAIDPCMVKRRYGDRLTLWGTIGTQSLLPFSTPKEIRRTVREYCSTLGRGGGYVIGPSHSIEADVPWANIEALYQAIEEYGVY